MGPVGSTRKIPDDATILVIARPTQPFGPNEVKVLREYLQRKEEKDKDGKEGQWLNVNTYKVIFTGTVNVEKDGDKITSVSIGSLTVKLDPKAKKMAEEAAKAGNPPGAPGRSMVKAKDKQRGSTERGIKSNNQQRAGK